MWSDCLRLFARVSILACPLCLCAFVNAASQEHLDNCRSLRISCASCWHMGCRWEWQRRNCAACCRLQHRHWSEWRATAAHRRKCFWCSQTPRMPIRPSKSCRCLLHLSRTSFTSLVYYWFAAWLITSVNSLTLESSPFSQYLKVFLESSDSLIVLSGRVIKEWTAWGGHRSW